MKLLFTISCVLLIGSGVLAQPDLNKSYKMDIPVLTVNTERQVTPAYVYYAALSPCRTGTGSFVHLAVDSLLHQKRWYVTNKTLVELYRAAASGNAMIPKERVILDVSDSSAFVAKNNQCLCYESVLPIGATLKQRCDKMLQDLDTYFGYKSRFEKRKVKVWLLKRKTQIHITDDTAHLVKKKKFLYDN